MISPVHDRVLIKPNSPETTTKSGIIIPDIAQDKPVTGTVVRVGPGKPGIPMVVKENDEIMYQKNSGIPVNLNGEGYLILKEEEIIGIMN